MCRPQRPSRASARPLSRRLTLLALSCLIAVATVQSAAGQPCAPPPLDMISWWPAEGSAVDIKDSNDGILAGTGFATGLVGQAFTFDGIDDKITIPHSANQNMGSAITIDAWIFLHSTGHGRPILQKRDANNIGGFTFETTDIGFGTPNGLQFVIWIGGVQHALGSLTSIMSGSVWQHVAVTYDGAIMRMYVNGVEKNSVAASGAIDATNDPMVIGNNVRLPYIWFDGKIDELHLFNRALSAAEILAIYNAGAGGVCPPPTAVASPVAPAVLGQNFPNPFNPETTIRYELTAASDVRFTVHDTEGRTVRTLVTGHQSAGPHEVRWNGRNEDGSGAATGVYFYRLQTGATAVTRKMVLIK